MSSSQNRLLRSTIDVLWTMVAALLLAGAVVVTLVRLSFPEIRSQQETLTAWIGELIGRPVTLGAIDADWDGWAPRIRATDIRILDPASTSELVRFENATIDVAPLDSLLAGKLRPRRMLLSGVTLTLIRHEDGHFSVAGMPPPKSPIIKWIMEQRNFSVTNADLTVIDQRAAGSFALRDLAVTLNRSGPRRHLGGYVELPRAFGHRLAFEISADDDPTGSSWNGTIAFQLERFNSNFLVDHLSWHGPRPREALIDIRGWTHWRAARLDSGRFELKAQGIDAGGADEVLLSAQGQLSRRARGWRFDLADIVLPGDAVPAAGSAGISAAWEMRDEKLISFVARGAAVPIEPLAALAAGLAPFPAASLEMLAAAQPRGTLAALETAWTGAGNGNFYVHADLDRVQLAAAAQLPLVDAAGVSLTCNREEGWVDFRGASGRIEHAARLVAPLELSALRGRLRWKRHPGERLDIATNQLSGTINGAEFSLRGKVTDLLSAARIADLVVRIPRAPARRIHEFVPRGLMPPRGEIWLREAFADGTLSDGLVLLRGPLAALPFRRAEGVLHAAVAVTAATHRYSRRWLPINDLHGRIVIEGPVAQARVSAGNVLNAAITDADILLPDLFTRERKVLVRGHARGPGASARAIVMNSPLKDGRARRLQDIDIDGDIDVMLDMDIALYRDGPRAVIGQAHFSNNRLTARKERITLDKLSGSVSFTRGNWYGEELSAEFQGTPVALVVNGGLDDPDYDTEFRLRGTSSASRLVDYLARYAPPVHRWLARYRSLERLNGALDWQAVLTLPRGEASELPRRLTIASSLRGLGIALPRPFAKGAEESRPLRVALAIRNGIAELTRIDFADLLTAEVAAVRGADGKPRASRIEVILGALEPQFTGKPNFSVAGYLPYLSASEWITLLGRAAAGDESGLKNELPLAYDLQVSHAQLWNYTFEDSHIRGVRTADQWQLSVAADSAAGEIIVPRRLREKPLRLALERLQLRPPVSGSGSAKRAPFDPAQAPELDVDIKSFQYGKVRFGETRLMTSRRDDGMHLDMLRFRDTTLSISASGDWTGARDEQDSRFAIEVTSASLADLLSRFGYSVANIEDGATEIGITARWHGGPMDFNLAGLSGTFELDVAQGRLLDVEPGSGRLFGLLSLQSLPRRLSLDFADLFNKGFAFDRISGLFILENGNAYTNSLSMLGPSARVDVSGRTGLKEQDYDQRVIVTPAVSDTLPVAGALFGPIGAGAGAVYFLGQKMFKSLPEQIDKILRREYLITGSWNDPAVEKI